MRGPLLFGGGSAGFRFGGGHRARGDPVVQHVGAEIDLVWPNDCSQFAIYLDLPKELGIFQRLNQERGITVLLITHEADIAEYGTRLIRFRDGRVVADQRVVHRRNAADELAALPPPEPDQIEHPEHPEHAGEAPEAHA